MILLSEIVTFPIVNDGIGNEVLVLDNVMEYPVSVVTRAKSRQMDDDVDLDTSNITDISTVQTNVSVLDNVEQVSWDQDSLKREQKKEFSVKDSIENEPEEMSKPVIYG